MGPPLCAGATQGQKAQWQGLGHGYVADPRVDQCRGRRWPPSPSRASVCHAHATTRVGPACSTAGHHVAAVPPRCAVLAGAAAEAAAAVAEGVGLGRATSSTARRAVWTAYPADYRGRGKVYSVQA